MLPVTCLDRMTSKNIKIFEKNISDLFGIIIMLLHKPILVLFLEKAHIVTFLLIGSFFKGHFMDNTPTE